MSATSFELSTQPTHFWTGAQMGDAFIHATRWLDANRDRINALNVFPVPDGDTGTNMAMTMRTAIQAIEDGENRASAVARQIAHGAFMGSRGNSGVILSQMLRGFANGLHDRDALDGHGLAAALDEARELAYRAVLHPVEGTMLTVIRGAAERALEVARNTPSLQRVLQESLQAARDTLAATPTMLETLREAGVVDAGGQGVVVILEGLERYATGQLSIEPVPQLERGPGAAMAFLDHILETHDEDAFGYCTNFMIIGSDIPFEPVRDQLARMGQSAVIIGDPTMVKVHLHTENPGAVLQYALAYGALDQIKIDNMSIQTETLAEQRSAMHIPPTLPAIVGDIAIVAVATGDGIVDALHAMGVTIVVPGGQTMNPSIQDLLAAVDGAPTERVILLPNNRNIILAANKIPELATHTVGIVPTESIPQALAALSVFNSNASMDSNVSAMTQAMGQVTTAEITHAVRDVAWNGIQIATGQVIGLIDGKLVASTDAVSTTAARLLDLVGRDDVELVTVFAGIEATEDDMATVASAIAKTWPQAETDFQIGGQPHYLFVISIE